MWEHYVCKLHVHVGEEFSDCKMFCLLLLYKSGVALSQALLKWESLVSLLTRVVFSVERTQHNNYCSSQTPRKGSTVEPLLKDTLK